MAAMSGAEDQARMLEDALGVVRQQTVMMRKCLETPGKLMDALKCCSTLVSELRTSNLGPKQYYELYMAIFDALRHLSVFLRDSHPVNHLADLYELVQYAGNIIPRLYLMITVGTAYMAIPDAPVKEIMKDMMEMSRGVQHPTRGLFLRYYLSGQARDYLPTGKGDGPEGNLQDSINFTLTNFVEMNKLWVRLQHQGHSREREQRTRERKELQLLVGSNLVRLSQLVDLETYQSTILQPLLEQVVQCRDALAQEYLLEVITQVFPDEYHLHTLDQFLSAIARLNPLVNVKGIVIGLMDRLSSYAQREADTRSREERQQAEDEAISKLLEHIELSKDVPEEPPTQQKPEEGTPSEEKTSQEQQANGQPVEAKDSKEEEANGVERVKGVPSNIKLFEIFHEQVMNLVSVQRLPIQDITALLVSLANLALNIYPNRLDYLDQVFAYAAEKTQQFASSADLHSQPAQSNMLTLLMAPINTYVSLFTAFALPNFLPVLRAQTYPTRRSLAGEISRSMLKNQTEISTLENLEAVLEVIRVLIKEGVPQTGGPMRRGQETEDTIEEQGWLARIVYLIKSPEDDLQLKLLQTTRRIYAEGEARIKHTTPALCTSAFQLVRRVSSARRSSLPAEQRKPHLQAIFKFVHSLISSLYARASAGGAGGAGSSSGLMGGGPVMGAANGTAIADLSLRLFLTAGQFADGCPDMEDSAYEFFAQAFTVYEEAISDSRAQYQAVCAIAGSLHRTRRFTRDNYDTLITKCALHGSRLLKKPDQCRAVCAASHLWWSIDDTTSTETEASGAATAAVGREPYRDGKRVLECLQRALRVADACMDAAVSVELFVEILNQYVYYFDQENEAVTTKYLNGLIELIHSNLATNEPTPALDAPRRHFERTLEYIRSREYEGVVTESKS